MAIPFEGRVWKGGVWTVTGSKANPVGAARRGIRLRESRVDETTSTRDSATWMATKPRPAIGRCAAVRDFRRVPGFEAPALQAGHTPKNSVVRTARAAVTTKTVWSGCTESAVDMSGCLKNGNNRPVPYQAAAAP